MLLLIIIVVVVVPRHLPGGTEKLQEKIHQGRISVPDQGLDPCTFRVHVTRTAASCNLHSPHCWCKVVKLLGRSRNQGERSYVSAVNPPPLSILLFIGFDFYSRVKRPGREGSHLPRHRGPGAHPASYTMGTGSSPGVKRPGRGVYHPPI